MGIEVTPLSSALGAAVRGIDLSQPLDAAAVAEIRAHWLEHVVLVFPDQDLDEVSQGRFGRAFGELQEVRTGKAQDNNHPGIMLITNVRDTGKVTALEDGDMQYHYDQCYYENPSVATILYAMEVPTKCGNTLFANCTTAYEALPADMKARIEGRLALNVYDYNADPTHRLGKINWEAPHWVHPVVRTHPETGAKAIYVCRLMSYRIEDMEEAVSDELLSFLFDHMEKPEFIYEHAWKVGELMMWDNRCSVHARADFDPNDRRMMRRITTKGVEPVILTA